jgi:cytoskeletal protein CcmA (bactofilin family)
VVFLVLSGASLEDAVAVLGKTPGSNASAFSLADWEAYSIAKGNPLKIDDIFQADDINDDDGLTDTISSSDISFNVVDASGLNVFGTASMQSIIPPITNTYSLGSATHVWKDVYIGPGSLYIDGQKVLESDADTIVVGADANQNLKLNTTGTGVLQIESAAGIQISSTGAGNIELGSTGTGIVRITDNLALNGNVEIFNDSSDMVKINDSLMVTGDISFNGNLYQNGALFTGGSTIDETTDVSLNNLIIHGDLSANDASFNVIDATSLRINGVDIIDGAPAALDTLSELATALDNSANFATNVLTTLSNKQDTLTAGTNITITGNTISASGGGGGGLTDLSATSISDLSDVSLNGIQVNQTLKWDGEKFVPTTLATTDTKQGQVLEILYGLCDGSTVTVDSGTYTMPSLPSHRSDGVNNVSTTTYTKDEASEITYTAPPGTDRIEFKFTEYLHSDNTSWIMLYILCIDDVEIDNTETLERPGMYAVGAYTLTATITSNETDLTQSHKYYFKLKHGETHPFKYGPLETVSPIWGLQSNDGFIPKLKITAIGESSGQAVTLTNNSVSDLSDISFNSTSTTDGQAISMEFYGWGMGSGNFFPMDHQQFRYLLQ